MTTRLHFLAAFILRFRRALVLRSLPTVPTLFAAAFPTLDSTSPT